MVKAWRELVTIPTYEVGKPERAPMFLEKRVYQGSSGVVYPYPVIEAISDECHDREWAAVYLENEYLKVMILPELGGRIQMAYDKIKQRHFVYYNHVIKPALVGLCGPWISGGIEFNWPQHHRPSTYSPVDSLIQENDDGSVTVWVNEMERMFHQKGMAGFTLRPGCAYLEIQGRVSNRTPLPQTFLWWANPAVEVNEYYQSVFPPDVNAVFDHGKRAVSSFPIATGTYYKVDYSAGVDISNYRNIPVPTSYMAVNSHYDFEGGYENDSHGGMLHVASHHYSPGKKQWTWGNGDFGRAWDRNLTDDCRDGSVRPGFRPYIELMAGVYTENQPDFTWLMPFEEKQFTQYFMPYRDIGIVKQASCAYIINIIPSEENHSVEIRVLATSKRQCRLLLESSDGTVLYDRRHELSPESVLIDRSSSTVSPSSLRFSILEMQYGRERPVLTWQPEPDDIRPIPPAAEAALPPAETKTIDQLYLTGLHLEQYRHATWSALDYYEEALRRDPNDYRCNMQTGLWYLRRARFSTAEPYLRRAVKVLKKRNPNPYDGEPEFYLGVTLKFLDRPDEAYDAFWKASWNKAWADAAYFEAALISISQERWDDALDELERSLSFNALNHRARAMKAVVLRKMGLDADALECCTHALERDPFNYVCLFEQHLLAAADEPLQKMITLMRDSSDNYDEVALDYLAAGLSEEARAVWAVAEERGAVTPMTYYYLGDYDRAESLSPDYCFPNRLEAAVALQRASALRPAARAPYYLGCLYYDKRQYDLATANWELSARIDPDFPLVWRNLALAYFNKQNQRDRALECMERAFRLDESDPRMLMELDQLYKRLHHPHSERLAFLQRYPHLISMRDDLLLEEITLLNQLGRYDEAMQRLDAHTFHPWEGGEGKVSAQYQFSRVEIAKRLLSNGSDSPKARHLLEECLVYPPHLGEGKLQGAQDNDFLYFLGRYEEGTAGPEEPAAALYYNDAKPDKIFYAALCYRKLGQENKARGLFNKLIAYGKQHLFDHVTMDYFAVSLPDLLIWDADLDERNRVHCLYLLSLGYYGLGDRTHFERYLAEAEALDADHQGIQQLRSFIHSNL